MCREFYFDGQPGVIEQIVVPMTLESGQACEVNEMTRALVDEACDDKAFANTRGHGTVVGDDPKYQCASK